MSILIKGEKMPETCEDCPCFYDYMECMALHKAFRSDMHFDCAEERRYEGCPLVEVPEPHGRLIDADKAITYYKEHAGNFKQVLDAVAVGLLLDEAPTVIEAEEQKHEHID